MSVAQFTKDFAKSFDAARKVLLGSNAKIVLLREDGETQEFNEVQVITSGWYSEHSRFYGNTTFNVADLSSLTGANIRKATHLIIRDSDVEATNNVIYEYNSSTVPPDTNIPWWRIAATSTDRKYVAAP